MLRSRRVTERIPRSLLDSKMPHNLISKACRKGVQRLCFSHIIAAPEEVDFGGNSE